MSRHTERELREMARTALSARDAGDPPWDVLCLLLADRLGLTFGDVKYRIEVLAA